MLIFYILSIASVFLRRSSVLAHPQRWPLGGASGLAGRMASCVGGFLSSVISALTVFI